MIETQHIHPDDLSLHALRLLPAGDAAEVQAHIRQCTECSRSFQQAQGDLAIVALTVNLESPRPQARKRFLDAVSEERRTSASTATLDEPAASIPVEVVPIDTPRRKPIGGTLLPWLGWAVAAGASFFAVSEYHQRTQMQSTIAEQSTQLRSETGQLAVLSAEAVKARELMDTLTGTGVQRVSLNTTPAAKVLPRGRASYVASRGALVFIADNLQPLPLNKVYELWIIPADGSSPVPAGTFSPDARGNASVLLPNIPKGIDAKAFGVTLEADGGASKPTLPILLVGAA